MGILNFYSQHLTTKNVQTMEFAQIVFRTMHVWLAHQLSVQHVTKSKTQSWLDRPTQLIRRMLINTCHSLIKLSRAFTLFQLFKRSNKIKTVSQYGFLIILPIKLLFVFYFYSTSKLSINCDNGPYVNSSIDACMYPMLDGVCLIVCLINLEIMLKPRMNLMS